MVGLQMAPKVLALGLPIEEIVAFRLTAESHGHAYTSEVS